MIKSINDIVREQIISNNNYISECDSKELNYVLDIMLCDLYKMFVFKKTKYASEIIERRYFNLKKVILLSDQLFLGAMKAVEEFYNMSLLDKSLLMDDLKQNDRHIFLSSINRHNVFDEVLYSFRYELPYLIDLYEDFINKNPKDIDLVIDYIQESFSELKVINYDKYRKFILEFIKIYYKYCIYNKICNKYFSDIRDKSIADLIEQISNDEKFLSELIKIYMSYNTSDLDIKQAIEEEFNGITDQKTKKKLGF